MRTHHHSTHHAPRPHGPAATTEHHDELVDVLTRLAHAITSGDGRAAAQLWDAPGFIIGADTVMAVSERDQLAALFAGARAQYNAHGVVDTRPDILDEDWLDERLCVVKVRWPYLDALGREVGAEASDYTLRRDPAGQLKLRIAIMRGVEPGKH